MKKLLFAILMLMPLSALALTEKLSSPDGRYEFVLTQHDGRFSYTLTYDGKTVVKPSKLGVNIDNKLFESALGVPNEDVRQWCENLHHIGTDRLERDTTWTPPYGEWSTIRDNYRQMTVRFMKGADEVNAEGYSKGKCYFFNIDVRAYNEGVAFRYSFPETGNGLFIHLTSELTEFAFEPGAEALCASWAQDGYRWKPLTGSDWGVAERPLTLRLANGLCVSLLEARLVDYARTKFVLQRDNVLHADVYSSVDFMTPYSTSWRTIMVGDKMTDLINHDYLTLNLNDPCALSDVSWIKPGKVFRSDLNKKALFEAVDFAAGRGLQYVHLDARWYGPEMKMSSSALAVDSTKDFTIPEVVGYAKEKGLGVFVYVNQRALYQQFDSILPLYKKWGVKGIKFGFVQVGNQQWTTWLHNAVRKCAEYGLMVDIHDEYRPTGYSRTYPNLMTAEGIRGNEEMPSATHNVILPFTRFLCGPADYTLCYYVGRKKTTHAHQLAMAAVYYSPLTWMYWYDKPSAYRGEPELEFWDKIPTVWDDTKALQGNPGEYIATARRSGGDWFVGVMTGDEARTVTLPLSFLAKGKKYIAHLYEDDATLKTRTKVKMTTKKVTNKTTLSLPLQKAGGAAVWIEEVK